MSALLTRKRKRRLAANTGITAFVLLWLVLAGASVTLSAILVDVFYHIGHAILGW